MSEYNIESDITIDSYNLEKECIGIYVSGHPLDDVSVWQVHITDMLI